MVKLPGKFLEWNYYPRRRLIEQMIKGEVRDYSRFFLEFTRHNPVLCTAALDENNKVEINGKVVGVGYVVKKKYLKKYIEIFENHLQKTDIAYEKVKGNKQELNRLYEEHSKRGLSLLLEHIYLERRKAEEIIDFEKLATVELAKRIPHSSKHTWKLVQRNKSACIVFFQPPSISYELKGLLSVHENDDYHKFVTLVHDAYHYTPLEFRSDRPVYIFHVLEVYDNSPSMHGFGKRIA